MEVGFLSVDLVRFFGQPIRVNYLNLFYGVLNHKIPLFKIHLNTVLLSTVESPEYINLSDFRLTQMCMRYAACLFGLVPLYFITQIVL